MLKYKSKVNNYKIKNYRHFVLVNNIPIMIKTMFVQYAQDLTKIKVS